MAKSLRRKRRRATRASTKRVYVYKSTEQVLGHDKVCYRVFPAVIVLEKGHKLELVNVAGGVAEWNVPAGPFGGPINEHVPKDKPSKAWKAVNGPLATEYVVRVNGEKAKGHSDPVIIIDP